MSVRIRFFARFRELLGSEIVAEVAEGTNLTDLVHQVTRTISEGHSAIFDEDGHFHEYVILMQNATRIDLTDAGTTLVSDGDTIAVFPPVAGG